MVPPFLKLTQDKTADREHKIDCFPFELEV